MGQGNQRLTAIFRRSHLNAAASVGEFSFQPLSVPPLISPPGRHPKVPVQAPIEASSSLTIGKGSLGFCLNCCSQEDDFLYETGKKRCNVGVSSVKDASLGVIDGLRARGLAAPPLGDDACIIGVLRITDPVPGSSRAPVRPPAISARSSANWFPPRSAPAPPDALSDCVPLCSAPRRDRVPLWVPENPDCGPECTECVWCERIRVLWSRGFVCLCLQVWKNYWCTVCIVVCGSLSSQKIFAFEWESPKTGRKTQLAWCVLPQGYKNSPTIFGEQLAKDLESWEPPPGEGQLLQYVDDLLIATQTQETCVDWTVSLLNFLGLQGYRVSQKKAQMVRQTVIYLGYEVSAGQRTLGQDRKEAICQTPKPPTVKELRTFLGMTGWCRLWIYNYGLLVKPLYALITEGSRDLQWTKDATRAFNQLKKALMSAPALGLPNVSKPFFLFSHEKQGIALGILAQNLGPYQRAVAYLSKQLDTAAKGWPGCLRAVAAVAINIQEARKFTLGQKMTVLVSHTMSAVPFL
ncbi:uncharacterized protein LOC131378756 [Hirundo rustica]|uniref:uncharacterized protein LOC131378756 n=1 Tax=Hirundo rustica TaxID=43150 RepID=UPI0026721078|nr:uncharacterized protein LOC131378756 [Hirundo rustica]